MSWSEIFDFESLLESSVGFELGAWRYAAGVFVGASGSRSLLLGPDLPGYGARGRLPDCYVSKRTSARVEMIAAAR
jgi:hypothetical protein